MPIKIPIISDVSQAIRGVNNLGDEFDKVADSLDGVVEEARDAEKAIKDWGSADSAVKDLNDGVQDAATGAERLEKKFRDAADAVKKIDGKPVRDLDDDFDRAARGADELKDEANDTAREAAASFDGSAEGIADAFQEVAANAFAGFGPAGAVAGLAAAAGIGIAISQLTKYAEEVTAAKEAGADWAQSFNTANMSDRIEALRSSWEELGATITDSKEWYEVGQENAVTAIEDIAAAAKAGVGDVDGFVEAFNTTDPTTRLRELQESLGRIDEEIADLGPAWRATLGGPAAEQAYVDRKKVLTDLQGVVEDQIAVQENANAIEDAYAASAEGSAQALAEKNEKIQESNELLEENVDANRNLISAEFDLQDAQKTLNEALGDGAEKGRSGKEALFEYSDSILSMGEAAAEASGDQEDYNRQIATGRERFLRAAEAMGYTRRQANDLADQMGLIPRRVEIRTSAPGAVGTKRQLEDVKKFAGAQAAMTIPVRADTSVAAGQVANFRYRVGQVPISVGIRTV